MSQQLLSRNADADADLTVPTELESTASKLVYLFVRTTGECTIDDLQSSLDMKKISLYPLLKSLAKKGLVEIDDGTYRPA